MASKSSSTACPGRGDHRGGQALFQRFEEPVEGLVDVGQGEILVFSELSCKRGFVEAE
jgi:hypothetical protein